MKNLDHAVSLQVYHTLSVVKIHLRAGGGYQRSLKAAVLLLDRDQKVGAVILVAFRGANPGTP